MTAFTKINFLPVIDSKKCFKFIKKSNDNKMSKEKIKECRESATLIGIKFE